MLGHHVQRLMAETCLVPYGLKRRSMYVQQRRGVGKSQRGGPGPDPGGFLVEFGAHSNYNENS